MVCLPKINHLLHTEEEEEKDSEQETLSQREKEIITCVVKGMTNKAIADKLYLSIHTVITHRRNIARKLQNGEKQEFQISSYRTGVNLPDAVFRFDKSKYPGAEIIDLR